MNTLTNVKKVCIHIVNKVIIIINKKIFLNTNYHRNNTNSTYKSSQKEYHIIIDRKYYTENIKEAYDCNIDINKTKLAKEKINKLLLIKKYQNTKKNKTNKIHKHNIKAKTNYKPNISLN